MKQVFHYRVTPSLPERLKPLMEMAYNLWWCWNPDAIVLFRRFHPVLWEESYYNPIAILGQVSQTHLEKIMKDDAFLAEMDRIFNNFQNYLKRKTWFDKTYQNSNGLVVAYFSAEFGLTECIQTYSGGLGVLSGDHLKGASDLGIPLVGIGLLYQQGYFHQYLNADGWQQELYPENDLYNLPIKQMFDANQQPVVISVEIGDHPVVAQIWKISIGRIQLYLLDCNVEANRPEDRQITAQLYGGDSDMRIRQEILLGIGGVRALKILGINPHVTHMNEGHSAFLSLERIRSLMEEQHLSFAAAREIVLASNVFTTHTPVPAGHDVFHPDLVERYLASYRNRLGLSREEFLGWGRQDPFNHSEHFSMTVLAIRLAAFCNGVSRLHGQVSRELWQDIWPEVPVAEIPITAITNGIHPRTWISRDMVGLLDRYLTPEWEANPGDPEIWVRVADIPDAELWRTHERRRERLVSFARRRLKAQLIARGASKTETYQAEEVLDPEILTLGFGRRFATYKRAMLLFRDPERFQRILTNKERPVQIIIAGKAHPRDNEGKDLIKQIVNIARLPEFRQHVVFLENYDMNISRYMVQGVDVWINVPRRPYEASGTSGMKVCFNGGLNLSILDGWWCEGYQPGNGWAIGRGEEYDNLEQQDEIESLALYKILEEDVVPLFYNRGADQLPRDWIRYMKNSMGQMCPMFNVHRMLSEYTTLFYQQGYLKWQELFANQFEGCNSLSQWRTTIQHAWTNLKILKIVANNSQEFAV
ncbi:alpha-glucan family phosphorylase, partial [candidate division KSB1 bacterium]|nr:alpha-glucan family phosphorylase [candidate division KSB1 bacterium]